MYVMHAFICVYFVFCSGSHKQSQHITLCPILQQVYSFGIILYETFSRKDPYEGEDEADVWREVTDPRINKRPPVPKDCPPQLASLMCDCLVANADERPSFEEVDTRIKRIEVKLAEEADKVDATQISLFDIFPRHIALALQAGKEVEPEHKDCVTIFFCDIVVSSSCFASIVGQFGPVC